MSVGDGQNVSKSMKYSRQVIGGVPMDKYDDDYNYDDYYDVDEEYPRD